MLRTAFNLLANTRILKKLKPREMLYKVSLDLLDCHDYWCSKIAQEQDNITKVA